MNDIARICGVSRQTVHAALNKKKGVSEETRARILETVRKYNYEPNRIATTLLGKTTNLVGVTILNIRNPFFADLIQGISSALNERGLHIIFFEVLNKEDEEEAVRNLLAYQVAGIIISPIQDECRLDHLKSLRLRNTPFVSIGPVRGLESHFVEAENHLIGYMAAEHLIERGHRRIVYLEGPAKIVSANERALGFLQCLKERGVPFDQSTQVQAGDTARGGCIAALEVLKHPKQRRPTAIVCFNDMVALGVYEAARELGLSIPDDLSVIGCDDIEIARLLGPPLTTIGLPIIEMGRSAAEMLLSQLTGDAGEGHLVKRFTPHLIERRSVKKLA